MFGQPKRRYYNFTAFSRKARKASIEEYGEEIPSLSRSPNGAMLLLPPPIIDNKNNFIEETADEYNNKVDEEDDLKNDTDSSHFYGLYYQKYNFQVNIN